jgi:ATP-dependent Clp protease ATP-binding subunit ClpC
MPNPIDIAPLFSPSTLKLIGDSLLAAASLGFAQASPYHLVRILAIHPQIEPLLEKLSATLAYKEGLPLPEKSKNTSRVSLDKNFKKIIFLAYGESLITNSPSVEPAHFLIPLNDYLQTPFDKNDLRNLVQSQVTADTTPKTASALQNFAENITLKASTGKIDEVIGREKEIDQVIRVLARRNKSNAILIGDPGVGKTAIVEGLALKISQGNVPPLIKNVQIHSLNLTTLLAGTSYQGELEERLNTIIKEVKRVGNIIVFIDEIHMIMGAGGAAGAMTAANILKPALARGELNVIGATTQDEYRQHIEKDSALERRFESVYVDEPSSEVTLKILASVAEKLTKHHGVTIAPDSLQAAVDLSSRYITDRFLPDKAIDLLDEATSGAKVAGHDNVSVEDIKKVLSQRTGIPVTSLSQEESLQLMNMEENLNSQIIGQATAVKSIADVIKRSRAGLNDPNRPIGSFLLLGPTGVGKTELAKVLARTVYQSEKAMIRLDMSEFTEAHTADKLIGAPPGYVGYEEGGQLTNPVRHRPYSLILLDELEKGHPKVFDIFLQVLEDGRLTDSQGHTVDFKNTIIIMTSNIDVSQFVENPQGADRNEVMRVLSGNLRPEFVNRIDDIVIMNSLTLNNIKDIARLQLNKLMEKLKQKQITLTIPDETLDKLAELGDVKDFGARPLKRLIQNHIEEPIAELIISGKLKPGESVDWTPDKI